MSYSVGARAATRAEVVEKIVAALDKVVENQPIHAADRAQAQAAAEAFLGVIPDANENQEFALSVSGSVSWSGSGADSVITSASVNVSASLVAKENA